VKPMDNQYSVEFKNVSKIFKLKKSKGKSNHRNFYALKDISFKVEKGDVVGVLGTNGSGKSTILKIITGVLRQTQGEVVTEGKLAALLELGAGFNMDYTGIENIYLNGTIMGYSKKEVEAKLQAIIDFADIGEFIYQPVKSYSSGMFVRLAFADPDILIVDEALSVGDIRFQQKCYRAMEALMKEKTVILVTHDTAAVSRFCKRVIWLEQGILMFDGKVDEALKNYQGFLVQKTIDEKKTNSNGIYIENVLNTEHISRGEILVNLPSVNPNIKPKGNGDAVIFACGLFNNDYNASIDILEPGDVAFFVARVEFKRKIERPLFGITIRDRIGNILVDINSEMLNIPLPIGEKTIEYRLKFKVPPLNKGIYTISVAVAEGEQEDHIQLCWLDDVWVFSIPNRSLDLPGLLYLDKGEIDIIKYR